MAYFLPSFFQKRLLKYALSRLGLVDTEALDPDSLGIRFGQRSTVELRDIGLKLEVRVLAMALAPRARGAVCGSFQVAKRYILTFGRVFQ